MNRGESLYDAAVQATICLRMPCSGEMKLLEGPNIYYSLGDTDGEFDYNPFVSYGGPSCFELGLFFQEIEEDDDVEVSCDDTASLLSIIASSLGCDGVSTKIIDKYANNTFTTSIISCLDDSSSWGERVFQYHRYGWYSSRIYDPCVRLDRSSPILPRNMIQDDYDDDFLKSGESYDFSSTSDVYIQ